MASLKDLTERVKKFFQPVSNAYNSYANNPVVKKAGQWQNQNIIEPFYKAVNNMPRLQISEKYIPHPQSKIGQVGVGLVRGAIESPLNIPRNLLVGYGRLDKEQLDMIQQKRLPNLQNYLAGAAPLVEAGLDLTSLGIGKNIAKQGAKEVVKGGLKQAIKKGAIHGAGYGGLGGLAYGLGNQYNKKFDVGEVTQSTLGGAALGGVLGGGTAAAGGIFGKVFNLVKSENPKLSDEAASKITKGYFRNNAGKFAKQATGMEPRLPSETNFGKKQMTKVSDTKYVPKEYAGLYKKIDMHLGVPDDIRDTPVGMSVKKLTKFEHDANVANAGLYDLKSSKDAAFLNTDGSVVKVGQGEHEFKAAEILNRKPSVMLPGKPNKMGGYDMVPSMPTSAVGDLQNQGTIRLRGGNNELNIDLVGTPTQEQISELQRMANNKKIVFDIRDANGKIIKSGQSKNVSEFIANVAQQPSIKAGLYDTHPNSQKLFKLQGEAYTPGQTAYISRNGTKIAQSSGGQHTLLAKKAGYKGNNPIASYLKETGDLRIVARNGSNEVNVSFYKPLSEAQISSIKEISQGKTLIFDDYTTGKVRSGRGLDNLLVTQQPSLTTPNNAGLYDEVVKPGSLSDVKIKNDFELYDRLPLEPKGTRKTVKIIGNNPGPNDMIVHTNNGSFQRNNQTMYKKVPVKVLTENIAGGKRYKVVDKTGEILDTYDGALPKEEIIKILKQRGATIINNPEDIKIYNQDRGIQNKNDIIRPNEGINSPTGFTQAEKTGQINSQVAEGGNRQNIGQTLVQPQVNSNVAQQPLSEVKGGNITTKLPETVNTELNVPKISSQNSPSSANSIHLKSIADGERQIDNLLGTGGMATGSWKQDYYYRQKAIEEIKAVAPPEVVAQVEKIQSAIDNLKQVRQEVDNVPSQQLNELKLKAEYNRLENKFSKTVKGLDKLKLDPKYFQIGKDELGRSKSVSVIPNEKVQTKLANNLESAKVKTEAQNYKEWQKQVFGEANTRTSTKAIEDLGKQIKTSTNQGILDNADNWKDKPKIFLTRETMERNIEDIAGKDAPMVKEKLIQPIFKAEAERNRFLNKERADIKNLGIKARSKESALVQELGEGKITVDEVKQRSPNADKVINAEQILRQKYDSYLTQLNKVLTRNGYDPIPKRKDYFHHFEDLNGAFEQIGVAIKANDLPTDINGLSADFKPGKTFFTAALKRKGDKSSIDAITGIDKYLDGASNQIYHTDNIQALRSFETALREKYAGTEHLTNFVADLGEYTNKLAGKKSMVDRAAESIVGRRIYTAANALKSQTGANMVGANVSSALTNFIPVTQTLATTDKPSVAQAMMGILKNSFKDDGFIDSSNFLTSRMGSDRLSMTNWQKIGQGGNWLFKNIDNFTSQLAVRSKYLEGIKKGLSEGQAMRNADDWGRKILGGRSAGEVPTLFDSKTLGFLTQFQLEVNNQVSFMGKDIPNNFSKVGAASALAQVFLYSYLYNNLYEKITGRRPAFDPLGVAQKTYEDYTNPNMKEGQATKNLVKNVSDQLPFTSALTGGRIPIGSAIPNPLAVINGESTWGKELKKPLYYLAPPTGGGQIKKAVEGLSAYSKGASVSDSGRVRYPIPQTATNAVRTGLFGQYSTPEAQQYFREGRNTLGEKQSQFLLNSKDKQGVYKTIIDNRNKDASIKIKSDESNIQGNIYQYMDDKGDIKGIDLSFPIKEYKPTGNNLLDKELLSDYKGSITSAKNSVMKAWELGAIDQGEAIRQLERLTKASGKGKKPKNISIKISKPKTVKLTKSKPFKGSRALTRKTPLYKISKAKKPKNIAIAVGKSKIPAYKIKKFRNTLTSGSRLA